MCINFQRDRTTFPSLANGSSTNTAGRAINFEIDCVYIRRTLDTSTPTSRFARSDTWKARYICETRGDFLLRVNPLLLERSSLIYWCIDLVLQKLFFNIFYLQLDNTKQKIL